VDVYTPVYLTSALVRVVGHDLSDSRPGRFTPRDGTSGADWIGGWVDHRNGLVAMEKRQFLALPGQELRLLDRPVLSESLYLLRNRGPFITIYNEGNTMKTELPVWRRVRIPPP
jgi:hypothetical protein